VDRRFLKMQAQAWARYRSLSAQADEWARGAGDETLTDDDVTANGPGSYLHNTETIRAWLPRVFSSYGIESMLDVPCGDGNWMRHVDLTGIHYIGWDVDAGNIRHARRRMPGHILACVNILSPLAEAPAVDLIFCRKFLPHLPNAAIRRVLETFIDSGARYLIADNYHADNDVDCPLDGGHTGAVGSHAPLPGYYYRPVNLEAEPFNLPGRVEAIDEPGLPGEQYADIRQEMVLFDLDQT